jgi:hypothetical protein
VVDLVIEGLALSAATLRPEFFRREITLTATISTKIAPTAWVVPTLRQPISPFGAPRITSIMPSCGRKAP